jgi:hypothetical protein
MEDNITLVDNDEIKKHIELILRQTDYTERKATEELQLNGYDPIKVIKKYLGITEKKELPMSTNVNLNQEIYKQMRHKLDNAMRNYNERKENNETKLK